jgi:hypothetical protein
VNGIATFSDLSIDKAGVGYRLVADGGGFNRTSNAFSITPASATQLAFTVEPTTTPAGSNISPSVRVTAQDGLGNTATNFVGDVTIALASNPPGGILSGTTTVSAAGGVAIFADLSIDKAGAGYTLQATATGLTAAASAPFDIVAASATQLVFTVQPTDGIAGDPFSPAVVVTALDGQGNTATDFIGNVTVELTAGTGTPGAGLLGTRTVAAVAGIATFDNVSVDRSGTGYTMSARASGLTGAISAPFDITPGTVTQLVFIVQPATSTAGAIGTTAVTPVNGIATFSDLSIDKAGVGYRLVADGGGFNRTSNAFSITPASATQLAFTVEPTTTASGSTISPSVRVAGLDDFGNTATSFVGDITIAIASNPAGGTLSGTTTVGAAGGIAIFSTLSIDNVGTGYMLQATATGLTAATSAPFDIVAGSATQLVFTGQPSNANAGQPITPAVVVTARDAQGNTATDFIGNVTLVITGGTGTAGATLSGTQTVAAVGGIATFTDLNIDRSGTGYTLTASASGLTGTVSAPFDISAGTVAALLFTVPPSDAVAGEAISPPVQVTAQDALGNTVSGFTGDVTVAITAGTGTGGATLSGTKTVAAVSGVATFSDLSIDKRGADYRLTATGDGLTPDTSPLFAISAAAATQLDFTVQPTTTAAGAIITPAVEVTAEDAFGNPANFTGDITVTIGTNPSGGNLSGTTTVPAVGGVAVFGNLSIDTPGVGYRLEANATGLTPATSNAFSIN